MDTHVKHRKGTTQQLAATNLRNFRSFLLMQQFAAHEIGARIAQARREAGGMTQEQLAEISSFSTRSLQNYEAGKTIPWKYLGELSRLLRKPTEWFLYGDDETIEPAVAALSRPELEDLVRRLEVVADRLERDQEEAEE